MGINTRRVVVGRIGDNLRMDYTAQDDTTNLAARLQTQAEPGTILVSEATYRLTQGYFTFQPLGAPPLKGHDPVQVFQLTGRQAGRTRIDVAAAQGLTTFVGRQRELEILTALLEKAQGGHGQIVGIQGEAGDGHSSAPGVPPPPAGENVTHLEGRCLSHGQPVLYLPLVGMLSNTLPSEDENEQTITERVTAEMAQVGMEATMAPYLLALLSGRTEDAVLQGLAPEVRRKQTFEALRTLFLALSQQRPLVAAVLVFPVRPAARHGQEPPWLNALTDQRGIHCCTQRDCVPVHSIDVLQQAHDGTTDIVVDRWGGSV